MICTRPLHTFGAVVVSLALLGACGGSSDSSAKDTTTTTAKSSTSSTEATPTTGGNIGAAATVILKGIKFNPGEIKVKAGDQVRWLWQEKIPHNVTGDGFKSATLDTGEFLHTFAKAGTYRYQCTVHAGMTGSVTVG